MPESPNEFTLLYPAICQDCGADLQVGEKVRKFGKKYYCLKKHKKAPGSFQPPQERKSQVEQQRDSTGKSTLGLQSEELVRKMIHSDNERIAFIVNDRLDAATKIMCRKFNLKESEINPDSVVLAEILRQLYGTIWLNKEVK